MNISEVRTKTVDQLVALLLDLRKEAFNLRFQRVSGELTNTSRVKQIRRNIAKIKTVLTEKKAAEGVK